MTTYNKLVRDKIPQIMISNGEIPNTRILNTGEFIFELRNKLTEEVKEYINSGDIEELADILEVCFALGKINGVTQEELLEVMNNKRESRGGFEDKIFLISKG